MHEISDKNNIVCAGVVLIMKNLLLYFILTSLGFLLTGCDSAQPQSELAKEESSSPTDGHSIVQIETNYGLIWIELFDDKTPKTVQNFIHYVQQDFYDDTLIHQILPGFIVQGGLFDSHFQAKSADQPIINESQQAPKHTRGTVAMMRGNNPNSATSEFFINLKDNASFDIPNGYAVFGKVIKGMEVLDKISTLHTCSRGPYYDDAPCDPVVIKKVVAMS
jgi:cyclophilin family peptidyl-prolyl cis-trans isomerase